MAYSTFASGGVAVVGSQNHLTSSLSLGTAAFGAAASIDSISPSIHPTGSQYLNTAQALLNKVNTYFPVISLFKEDTLFKEGGLMKVGNLAERARQEVKDQAEKILRLRNEFGEAWGALKRNNPQSFLKITSLLEKHRKITSRLNAIGQDKTKENYKTNINHLNVALINLEGELKKHGAIFKIIEQLYPHGDVTPPSTASFSPKNLTHAFILLHESIQTWNGAEAGDLKKALVAEASGKEAPFVSPISTSLKNKLSQDPQVCAAIRKVSLTLRRRVEGDSQLGLKAIAEVMKEREEILLVDLADSRKTTEKKIDALAKNAEKLNEELEKETNAALLTAFKDMYAQIHSSDAGIPDLQEFHLVQLYFLALDPSVQKICLEHSN